MSNPTTLPLAVDFLNTAAVIYVVSRIFYSVAYITTTSEPLGESMDSRHASQRPHTADPEILLPRASANVRSVIFLVGVSTCFTLFVR